MQREPRKPVDAELQEWIEQHLDEAVHELTRKGLVAGIVVEAKPAWIFPFKVLIGRIREQGRAGAFEWFIRADGVPTAHAGSPVATTVREAARHFALRWQLDAARMEAGGDELAELAEALYRWVETPELWPPD